MRLNLSSRKLNVKKSVMSNSLVNLISVFVLFVYICVAYSVTSYLNWCVNFELSCHISERLLRHALTKCKQGQRLLSRCHVPVPASPGTA